MGKFIMNGVPYGGTSYRELTLQEYEALSAEEQMNGTMYFVIDGQGDSVDNYFYPMLYSIEEREVGTWIDGKPIYAKSYTMSGTANEQRLTINTDIETIVKTEGYVTYDNNRTYLGLNEYISNTLYTMTHVGGVSTSNVEIYNYSTFNNAYHEINITLFYTKTTDVAGSGKYNTLGVPNHHYSTDEKIVGTWIDGSTIYEKTFTATINSTQFIIQTELSIDEIIDFEACGKKISGGSYVRFGQTYNDGGDWLNVQAAGNNIRVMCSNWFNGASINVTIRYTKTS